MSESRTATMTDLRASSGVSARNGRRVMIIDDDRDFAETLKDILESGGYEVRLHHDARSVFEDGLLFDPKVALVDIRLGRDNGIDLVKRARAHIPDLLCVMVTAYGTLESAVTALQEGAYDYLRKPVDAGELFSTLDRCFERIRLENEKRVAEAKLRERNEELEQINARLRLIVESAKLLPTCSDLQEFGPLLLREFSRNMAAEAGSLYLVGMDALELVHTYAGAPWPDRIPLPLPPVNPFERAIETGSPVLIRDLSMDPSLASQAGPEFGKGSLLTLPLLDGQGCAAGLIALHNRTVPPFTNQDRELGLILASLSAEVLRELKASLALQESEERFRTLVSNIPGAVYRCRLDSDWTMEFLSDNIEWMTGRPARDFIGNRTLSFASIIHDADRESVVRAVADQIRFRDSFVLEYRIRHADGSVRWVQEKGRPVYDRDGNALWIDGAIFDITDRRTEEEKEREREQALQRAQRMESLGVLAGGIAHDFNNILSGIIGYTNLAILDLEPRSMICSNLEEVMKAANRASDLVQQILAFSRQSEKKFRPVRIDTILREAMKLLRASIPATIEIKQKTPKDFGCVLCDPTEFHQVIMNLCTNACHAMEERGGTLEVVLEKKHLSQPTPTSDGRMLPVGDYAVLRVSDTGEGIPEEIQARVFDPFFTTKEVGKGTGMGLSVVHGVVARIGGSVTFESRPGKGTAFEVSLPLTPSKAREPERKAEIEIQGKGRILFVDDEQMIVKMGVRILQRCGYEVFGFSDSEEALERFRGAPNDFDLVVTDYTMPKMTGDRLAFEMLQIRPDLPIILTTGMVQEHAAREARQLGIREVVLKPFRPGDFTRTVSEILGNTGTSET